MKKLYKIYEIKNFLYKKVVAEGLGFRNFEWIEYSYNNKWVDYKGLTASGLIAEYFHEPVWREYEEPNEHKVKRYWKWLFEFNGYSENSNFADENGFGTDGLRKFRDETIKKAIKVDDRWIEVDGQGEIVATSWDKKRIKAKENEMKKYYYLKKGDIIKEGDEVETSNSFHDEPKWEKEDRCIGKKAPDPSYPAHRIYRREIKEE